MSVICRCCKCYYTPLRIHRVLPKRSYKIQLFMCTPWHVVYRVGILCSYALKEPFNNRLDVIILRIYIYVHAVLCKFIFYFFRQLHTIWSVRKKKKFRSPNYNLFHRY